MDTRATTRSQGAPTTSGSAGYGAKGLQREVLIAQVEKREHPASPNSPARKQRRTAPSPGGGSAGSNLQPSAVVVGVPGRDGGKEKLIHQVTAADPPAPPAAGGGGFFPKGFLCCLSPMAGDGAAAAAAGGSKMYPSSVNHYTSLGAAAGGGGDAVSAARLFSGSPDAPDTARSFLGQRADAAGPPSNPGTR